MISGISVSTTVRFILRINILDHSFISLRIFVNSESSPTVIYIPELPNFTANFAIPNLLLSNTSSFTTPTENIKTKAKNSENNPLIPDHNPKLKNPSFQLLPYTGRKSIAITHAQYNKNLIKKQNKS